MRKELRSASWATRLLLFAAVTLGIVTMHTLGHSTGRDSGSLPGNFVSTTLLPGQHFSQASADLAAAPLATDEVPHGGMDPMSVCLAVVGTWTVILLAAGGRSRRRTRVLDPALAALRLLSDLRPIPPPRCRTRLSQLSVLRL